MKTEDEYCHECGEKTVHRAAGMMPMFFTQEETGGKWEKVAICSNCGGMTQQAVNSDEVKAAHKRYLSILVDEGIITEERKKEVLD